MRSDGIRRIAMVMAFLLAIQTMGVFGLYTPVQAAGTEIKENILTNLKVTLTDQNQSVTVSVYDQPEDIVLNYDWEQDAQVRLDYDWELPANHGYTAGSTFSFKLPEQFKLYSGSLNFPLDSDEGPMGTFSVNHVTNQAVMTFNEKIEELDNIKGTLWFESEFNKETFANEVTQDIVFEVKDEQFYAFKIRFKPDVDSNIKKSGVPQPGYFNAQTIKWAVDVNRVTEAVYGAVITDTLPDGLEWVPDSIEVYALDVKLNGEDTVHKALDPTDFAVEPSDDGSAFKIELGTIDKAYRIVYDTQITDMSKTTFVNTAHYSYDGNAEGEEVNATVMIFRGPHLAKKSRIYDQETQTIFWEIEYNYDEQEAANPVLVDVFDASQSIVAGSFKVHSVILNSDGKVTPDQELVEGDDYELIDIGPGHPYDDDEHGFQLTFKEAVDSAYKISYQTKPIDYVKQTDNITNTAMNGDSKVVSVRQIKPLVIAMTCGPFDHAEQTVGWNIQLHGQINALNEVVLTNTLDNQLELDPTSLIIRDANDEIVDSAAYDLIYNAAGNPSLTLQFNQDITEKYSISYLTHYEDQTGGISSLSNQASVEWLGHEEYSIDSKSVTRDCDIPVNNINNNGFKTGDYSVEDREITWQVGVNYNRMTLNDAMVIDELLQGQKLVDNSVEVHQLQIKPDGTYSKAALLDPADYDNQSTEQEVKISLGDIDAPYLITFKTSYSGSLIKESQIHNTAYLMSGDDQVGEGLTAQVTIPYGGEHVFKTGAQDGGQIDWSIYINRGLSYVEKARIIDLPSDNQQLVENSFKLYTTHVDGNGKVTKAAEAAEDLYSLSILTDDVTGTQSFELEFSDPINTAYILEYRSLIDAEDGETISNDVQFEGENVDQVEKLVESEVVVATSSGGGTSSGINRKLTVVKVDEANALLKLSGASFTLERLKNAVWEERGTDTTDEQGEIVFEKIVSGTYRITETASPAGYEINTEPLEFKVVSTEGDKVITVKNKKVTDPEEPPTDPEDPKDPPTDPEDPKDPPTDPEDPKEPPTDPEDPKDPDSDDPPRDGDDSDDPTNDPDDSEDTPRDSDDSDDPRGESDDSDDPTSSPVDPSETPSVIEEATDPLTDPAEDVTFTITPEETPAGGLNQLQEGSDNEEVQTIEIEDEDVPLGTLQMTNGTETSMLPKTGEGSRLPYYSVGMLLMFTGVWVWAWGSRRKRGLTH